MLFNDKIKDVRLGSTDVLKVYQGSDLVWERVRDLPEGYVECEYLEASGIQYILDTSLSITNGLLYRFETDIMWTDISKRQLFGTSMDGAHYYGINAGGLYAMGTTAEYISNIRAEVGQWSTINFIRRPNIIRDDGVLCYRGELYVDGVFATSALKSMSGVGKQQLYIYGLGSATYRGRCRISKYRVYEENELIAYFLPCLDNNGKPCMYDIIRKVTLYNKDTKTEFNYKVKGVA